MADWWRCPNDPPCPHAAVYHDVYDYDDPFPRCCMAACDCGRSAQRGAEGAPITEKEQVDG